MSDYEDFTKEELIEIIKERDQEVESREEECENADYSLREFEDKTNTLEENIENLQERIAVLETNNCPTLLDVQKREILDRLQELSLETLEKIGDEYK